MYCKRLHFQVPQRRFCVALPAEEQGWRKRGEPRLFPCCSFTVCDKIRWLTQLIEGQLSFSHRSVYSVLDPSLQDGAAHTQGKSPLVNSPSLETPSCTCSEVCLLGEYKCNYNKPLQSVHRASAQRKYGSCSFSVYYSYRLCRKNKDEKEREGTCTLQIRFTAPGQA